MTRWICSERFASLLFVAKKTRSSRPRSSKAPSASDLSYEQAIGELETLIDQIESGEIGLEQSLEHYERGVELLRRCRSIVDQAEQRLEELSIDDDLEDEGLGE